jgi:hypothetical protein
LSKIQAIIDENEYKKLKKTLEDKVDRVFRIWYEFIKEKIEKSDMEGMGDILLKMKEVRI